MKNSYRLYTPGEFASITPTDLFQWLWNSVETDILKMNRVDGFGIFIRENLVYNEESGVTIAMVMQWKTIRKELHITPMRFHVFTGDMPDALLDDINFVKTQTKDPIWT